MSKDFTSELDQYVKKSTPDLWSRIEPELKPHTEQKVINIQKKRINKIVPLVACAAAVVLLIIGGQSFFRHSKDAATSPQASMESMMADQAESCKSEENVVDSVETTGTAVRHFGEMGVNATDANESDESPVNGSTPSYDDQSKEQASGGVLELTGIVKEVITKDDVVYYRFVTDTAAKGGQSSEGSNSEYMVRSFDGQQLEMEETYTLLVVPEEDNCYSFQLKEDND